MADETLVINENAREEGVPNPKDKVVINCLKKKPKGIFLGKTPDNNSGYVLCDTEDGKQMFQVKLKDFVFCDDGWWRAVDFDKELPGGDQVSDIVTKLEERLAPLKNGGGDTTEIYTKFVTEPIKNGEGLKAYHAFMRTTEGKKFTVAALSIYPHEVFDVVKMLIAKEQPNELIFCLDRDLKRPRGIDPKWKKILTMYKYTGPGKGQWETFLIPFTGKEVGEPIRDNVEWNDKLEREIRLAGLADIKPNKGSLDGLMIPGLKGSTMAMRAGSSDEGIKVNAAEEIKSANVGLAYFDKIKIETWNENENGFFYEGQIQKDKLDKGVQLILDRFNLDINNVDQMKKFIKETFLLDVSIKTEANGYYRGVVEGPKDAQFPEGLNKAFPMRRSKTRAFLEVIETLLAVGIMAAIKDITGRKPE
jgi:hypothetical protein